MMESGVFWSLAETYKWEKGNEKRKLLQEDKFKEKKKIFFTLRCMQPLVGCVAQNITE